MKKLLILLLFVPLLSCNDWLTVEPEDSVTFVNYFKNESEVEAMYNGILTSMKSVCMGTQPYFYISIDADNLGMYYEGYRELDPFTYLDEESMTLDIEWGGFYNVIYLANVMIENEYRFENISKERREFWLGQAHFAKALTYFRLAQIWGDVPIAKSSESIEPEGKKPALEVLNEALREAKLALTLPTHDKLIDAKGSKITSKQYASLGTVNTLLANIYAWLGGLTHEREYWEEAERHASEVIDGKCGVYELESMDGLISNVFGMNRNSVETIFCIDNDPLDVDRKWWGEWKAELPGQMLMSYPYTTLDEAEIANIVNDSWDEYVKITVETVKSIYPEEEDARRREFWYQLGELTYPVFEYDEETWDMIEVGREVTPYAHLAKWRDVIIQTSEEVTSWAGEVVIATDGDWVIWRLADLILLRAECRVNLEMATAVNDLNMVRYRAELGDYSGPKDKESLRREIFDERRRELFGEGQYYFDIVRNGYWQELLYGNFKTLTDQDVKNGALYAPVGVGAFTKNTLMTQNTYWQWQK